MTKESLIGSFRTHLSPDEQVRYDQFNRDIGRKPASMWELMVWSSERESAERKVSQFWSGVFGL